MDQTPTDSSVQPDPIGKVAIPPLDGVFARPWSVRKLLGLMAAFGPAAIVASIAIGAGETIVVVRAGSWAGYDLLWLVVLSCIVKGVFVTHLFVSTTAMVWTGASFDLLIQIAGFLMSNLALALVMVAALYLDHQLPPAYRTRLPVLVGGVISAIVPLCLCDHQRMGAGSEVDGSMNQA